MTDSVEEEVRISRATLRIAAAAVSVRLRDPGAEQRRLALVAELLRLQSTLGRALGEHARHSLSEWRGSHSTWDVVAEAEEVYVALEQYGNVLQAVVRAYGAVIPNNEPDAP